VGREHASDVLELARMKVNYFIKQYATMAF